MWHRTMGLAIVFGTSLALLAQAPLPAYANIVIDLGRGPVTVYVPSSYDPQVAAPLVLLLHGYSWNGVSAENYFHFLPLSEELGFLYVHPDGSIDQAGYRFWNGTDACCDVYGSGIDDSGYLLALVNEIKARLSVDTRRVYFFGHSNGAFMAYRMACDHPEAIAAIGSLAGATYYDPADCSPDSPVHVLQIHGTADGTVLYQGGILNGAPYPGAVATVEQWALFDGCEIVGMPVLPLLDLDAGIPGAETEVTRYARGCQADGSAELWTIVGGGHIPSLSGSFSPLVIDFFLAHPKSPPTAAEGAWEGPPADAGELLFSADPNPFKRQTQLRFLLSEASPVVLTVYDVSGRAIRRLMSGEVKDAGEHQVIWDGRGDDGQAVSTGVYFVRLAGGPQGAAEKIVLLH